MAIRKSLFEVQKGKQMRASGSWKVTRQEDLLIKAVGFIFAASVIVFLLSSFLEIRPLLLPSLIYLIVSFMGMFVVLFGLVYRKSRKEPMEKHYYDVDYRYDGIRNEVNDRTREISKEEFHGKEKQE